MGSREKPAKCLYTYPIPQGRGNLPPQSPRRRFFRQDCRSAHPPSDSPTLFSPHSKKYILPFPQIQALGYSGAGLNKLCLFYSRERGAQNGELRRDEKGGCICVPELRSGTPGGKTLHLWIGFLPVLHSSSAVLRSGNEKEVSFKTAFFEISTSGSAPFPEEQRKWPGSKIPSASFSLT